MSTSNLNLRRTKTRKRRQEGAALRPYCGYYPLSEYAPTDTITVTGAGTGATATIAATPGSVSVGPVWVD